VMDRRPGSSRVICSTRQPGIGQSLFILRSMGADVSPFKHQRRPAQSTQTAGEPHQGGRPNAPLRRSGCVRPARGIRQQALTKGTDCGCSGSGRAQDLPLGVTRHSGWKARETRQTNPLPRSWSGKSGEPELRSYRFSRLRARKPALTGNHRARGRARLCGIAQRGD